MASSVRVEPCERYEPGAQIKDVRYCVCGWSKLAHERMAQGLPPQRPYEAHKASGRAL